MITLKLNTLQGASDLPDDTGRVAASLLEDENGWINSQRFEKFGGMLI